MSLDLFAVRSNVELLLSLALFAVKAFALVDAATRSPSAFVAADKQTKTFWLLILALFLAAHMLFWQPISIINFIGTVAAFVYLADARPALREVGGRGGGGRGPYG